VWERGQYEAVVDVVVRREMPTLTQVIKLQLFDL
jgi:hypothetical protein